MGGFEGGDEGGFWDEEALFNPPAKQNARKKEKNKSCIEIEENLYVLHFAPSLCTKLTIEAHLEIQETICKAYEALLSYTQDGDIEEFFCNHKVVFEPCKDSSHKEQSVITPTEAFLLQTQDACSLCLTPQELKDIAQKH